MTDGEIAALTVTGLYAVWALLGMRRCPSKHFDPAMGQHISCFMVRGHKGTHCSDPNRRVEWR